MLLFAVSCEKTEENSNSDNKTEDSNNSDNKTEEDIFFGLNKESIVISPEGGSVDILVYSNHKWEIKGGSDWCTPSVTCGNANENGEKVSFSAELTYDDRETIFWFCCADEKITFVVTQKLKETIIPDANNTFDIPAEGGVATLNYQTNVECKVVIPESANDWISVATASTRGLVDENIKLDIAENTTYSARTAVVKIVVSDNEEVYSEYIVNQKQNDGLIGDDDNINVSSIGGNVNLTYKTNVECKVIIPESANDWISISPTTKTLNPQSTSLQISENNTYENRTAVVKVVAVSNDDLAIEYTINQEQNDAIIADNNRVFDVPFTGGDIRIEYQTNVDCKVVIPDDAKDWISIVPATRGLVDTSVTLHVSENTTYDNRTATVKVVKVGSEKHIIEYTINQEQNDGFFPDEQSILNVGGWDTTVDIKYKTNIECEIIIPDNAKEWVANIPKTKGFVQESSTLRISANYTGAERIAVIKVVAVNREDISAEYTIIQNPRYYLQYTSIDKSIISPYSKYAFGANIVYESYSNEEGGFIDFDAQITKIGEQAFYECSRLESIVVPEGIITIGKQAFKGCGGLNSINIPEEINVIENETFSGCSSLENIVIPNSITKIGDNAFNGCSSLKKVEIPKSVITIGKQAFSGCSGLQTMEIPESVTSIGSWAFSDCTGTLKVNTKIVENNTSSTSYSCFQDLKFTDLIIGDNITKIGSYKFEKNKFENITIPNSVTSIGKGAFSNSMNLSSLNIPDSVTTLGEEVFRGCALENIALPNSVSSIGKAAFQSCRNLVNITFPNGISSIGEKVLNGCISLKNFTIPNSVTSIEREAFSGCSSLQNIDIPNSVTTIHQKAFWGCTSFTDIYIPYTVTSVYGEAFSGCSGNLTVNSKVVEKSHSKETNVPHWLKGSAFSNITIGEDVTKIGWLAFYDANCEIVIIPKSVTYIDAHAFSNSSITSITIPDGITTILNDTFYGCQQLKTVSLPNSVTTIGTNAFTFCYGLESIIIPDSVTSIGAKAFQRCNNLATVMIGKSVASIGAYAFDECPKLTSVYCKPLTPPKFSTYNTFGSNITDQKFYVPTESLDAYKTSWSAYYAAESFVGYNFN